MGATLVTITLTEEDILRIHYALVEEFEATDNPITPPGIRNQHLLASAVCRQHSSLGTTLKYPDPLRNAATLTFGLCCDHPFHNGNKRTALVSLLVHLDKNKFSLAGVQNTELFKLVLSIVEHKVIDSKTHRKSSFNRPIPDDEVESIANWLKQRAKPIKRGEKQITYRELRKILERYDFELGNPNNNTIQVLRVTEEKGFLRKSKVIRRHIGTIPYPRENGILSIKDIKYVRQICKLREEDGTDSNAFYENGVGIDFFINKHRKILQRLANK